MHELVAGADHVLMDIGNVLVSFQPQWILDQLVPQPLHRVFLSSVFASREWIRLDLGMLTYEDAARQMCQADPRLGPHHALVLELLHRFPEVMSPLSPAGLLQPLRRAGKKVYLLSNFHAGSYAAILRRFPFLTQVDGAVISAHEHCAKPGARIYRTLLARFGVDAHTAVFIDDMPDNVHTARRLGIPAIQYRDGDAL